MTRIVITTNNGYDSVLLVKRARVMSAWTMTPQAWRAVVRAMAGLESPADWPVTHTDATRIADYGRRVATITCGRVVVDADKAWRDVVSKYWRDV